MASNSLGPCMHIIHMSIPYISLPLSPSPILCYLEGVTWVEAAPEHTVLCSSAAVFHSCNKQRDKDTPVQLFTKA